MQSHALLAAFTGECPSEDILARYGEQGLSAQERRTIEAHLDRCPSCDVAAAMFRASHVSSLQYGSTLTASLDVFMRRSELARAWSNGATLGRYRILRRVGMGAMGVVFAAHDEELDRDVALKVLFDASDKPEVARTRLVREARSMAKLTHPHVVTAYDVGVADGHVFLAMELVSGTTLREWLARKPTHAEIVLLFKRVADAIDVGHRAGIVHRDIKPQNILVTVEGLPKVTDFGLADASFGAERLVVGTPAYMAAEALEGNAEPASDQFALAVCLHEALSGERPFPATTLDELRELVKKPPRIHSSIKGAMRAALVKSLDPDPRARFSSIREFSDAVPSLAARRFRERVAVWSVVPAALLVAGIVLATKGTSNRATESPPAARGENTPVTDVRPAVVPTLQEVPIPPTVAAAPLEPSPTPPRLRTVPLRNKAPAQAPETPKASASPVVADTAPASAEASSSASDWMRSRR